MSYQAIQPQDCEGIPGRDFELVDVRTPAEFEEVHAEGARLMPLDKLDATTLKQQLGGGNGDGRAVYLICRSGDRSKRAADQLTGQGLENVYVVEGGTQAWEAAGLAVKRGRKTISLERQVRIGAGSLVITGVLLGWLVHPLLYLLSAFVGAGLVFAGVTDTCGMAMMLAKMPWNQRSSCDTDQSKASDGGGPVCSA
jgi:rhodanese-related sulfurtransferase